jgi:UDP-glucose 4-epimerase
LTGNDRLLGARVLVTGGCGYIGSHTVLALLDRGAKPVVLDDLSNGDTRLLAPDVPLLQADCGDSGALNSAFDNYKFDAVIHFAGKIIVTESMAEPDAYYRANTVASHALLSFVRARKLPLVFSSTAAVYGVPEASGPIQEEVQGWPISPYGRSKLATEWMLRDFAAADAAFRYVALRYFNVVGADAKGRAGQMGRQVTHLIKAASQVAAGLQKELTIFGNDYPTRDGTCERDYVHVSDLADAHVLALQYLLSGGQPVALNCGYGRGYTILEVLKEYERVLGEPLPFRYGPRRPADPPTLVAATDKIAMTLGWKPRYMDLGLAIQSALDWEKIIAGRLHNRMPGPHTTG